MSFAATHGLDTQERRDAAAAVGRRIQESGIEMLRVSFPDQHGLLRGKTIVAADLGRALDDGVSITSSLFAKDTANRTVFPVWSKGGGFGIEAFQGAGDVLMLPDPTTFRVLPWLPRTGWVLADVYFADGKEVPFATRGVYRRALARLADAGYDFIAGLEVEFHVFKLERASLEPHAAGQPGPPPEVSLLTQGYQYLSELRLDQLEPALELIRREVVALGLLLRSVECEYGPSQAEFTFHAGSGIVPADTMILFRSAVKQICRRHGLHATFMCRPHLPNVMSSGWHLHQSLIDRRRGGNAFVPQGDGEALSLVGCQWLAGLLAHARAATVFTTPTINGYKRYRPNSLAPDRVIWARDNRGAMLRVLARPGDAASRIENRAGEPAANPYLYMASQVLAGLDGVQRALDPGPSADTPYDVPADRLPRSLGEAADALRVDSFYREQMGAAFVDYLLTIKDAEMARFLSEVTDWEQRVYLDMY
jgi:glutamine synthetase